MEISASVGFYCKVKITLQGHMNTKFVNAKQAKETYQYRNTREKLYKKKRRQYGITKYAEKRLTPNYTPIKIKEHVPVPNVQSITPDDGQRK
jgi:hypothetical protein